MNYYLLTSAILSFLLGALHSGLGEKMLLTPLFEREFPKLMGSEIFAKRTLRFAWHITTALLWGLAAVFYYIATQAVEPQAAAIIKILSIGSFAASATGFIGSRGKHFSGYAFLLIGIFAWIGVS